MLSKPCVICGKHADPPVADRRTCGNPACHSQYERHLWANGATCRECGRPLSLAAGAGNSVCHAVDCQIQAGLHLDIADYQRCSVCRVPLSNERLITGACGNALCQSIHRQRTLKELEDRSRRIREERLRTGLLFREAAAAERGLEGADQFLLTFLTDFANPVVPLPRERRDEFRDNLERLVAQLPPPPAPDAECPTTADEDASLPTAGPDLDRLSAAVCGACRGNCCRQGETHAYVAVTTLQRVLRQRADLSPEDLVGLYTSFFPEETFENSCVFHTLTGCALPGEIRSSTCNEFFCNGLHELRLEVKEGATQRAFVIIRDETDFTQFVRGNFIDAEPAAASPAPAADVPSSTEI